MGRDIRKYYIKGLFYSYLRNSKYELGFLINFNSGGVDIERVIYTNDNKKHVNVNQC
jgi:hypothetical protein